MEHRQHTDERLKREWEKLYGRMKLAFIKYGENHIDGGDYYLVDENFDHYMHQVEFHKLHMLRAGDHHGFPKLACPGYPDWEIAISLRVTEQSIVIDPNEGLTLCDDGIIDALDRALLPEEISLWIPGEAVRLNGGGNIRLPGSE